VKAVASSKVNKVVLAYSGGLDTSVILKWLQDTYGCEVVTFTADLGQVGTQQQQQQQQQRRWQQQQQQQCRQHWTGW
jgi:argininosuccinate synthase